MRKNLGGKVVKRAMAVALAVVMTAGSVMPTMAVEQPSYVEDDNYVDETAQKFNNTETAIDPSITKDVTEAQKAADAAADAADAAQDAADEAQKQAKDAEEAAKKAGTAATEAESAADTAAGAAADAANTAGENSNYEYKTDADGNVTYEKKDGVSEAEAVKGSYPDSKTESAWEEAAEVKGEVDSVQRGRDSWQRNLEENIEDQKEDIDVSLSEAQKAAAAAETARIAAEAAAAKAASTSDLSVAKAAQVEVQQAADTAAMEALKAKSAYEEALAKLALAQKNLENAKAFDASANLSEDARIQAEKNELNGITLTDSEKELADAEAEFQKALAVATEAAEAAEKASDASNTASDLANNAAGEAKDQSELAADHADDAMNYYVDPAQDKLDAANKKLEDQKVVVSGLEKQKTDAEIAYNGIVPLVTDTAVNNYHSELAKKLKEMQDAEREWKSIPSWRVFSKEAARIEYENSKKTYNNYNNESKKNEVIQSALEKTAEYKTLSGAQKNLSAANSTLASLTTDAQKKSQAVVDAEAVRDAYLVSVKAAQDEQQKAAIVNALKAAVGTTSDEINQTQYDAALNAWASDVLTALNIFNWEAYTEAGKVRTEYIPANYNVSELSKIFEHLGISQWVTNPDKLIKQVETSYFAVLKLQEEELATVNAYIAKTDAAGAAQSADVAAKLAADAAKKAKAQEEAAKAAADLTVAQNKLNAAKDTLAKAQASLKAAKEAASKMNAKYVSFDKVMQIMEDAQLAVDNAKKAKEKAEADAKAALEAKNKVDSIVANWKSTPDTVTDDDGIDESAIVRTQVTAPAQLPTVQATTIDETPIALAAEPTTTRRVRTAATVEEETVIEEEETPAVAEPATEEVVEEDAAVDADTTEIVDEDTALASTMQENGFAWWWILILIAVVTGGGFAGYRYYKNKKVIED